MQGTRLDTISSQLVTVREVVSEVKDRRSRQALEMMPYELTFREPSSDAITAGRPCISIHYRLFFLNMLILFFLYSQ